MLAIAISGLHYQQVRAFAFLRPGVNDFAGRDDVVAHAPDVAGKQQLPGAAVDPCRDLNHACPQNVRRVHEAEGKLGAKLFGLAKVHGLEARQALLRLLHGVERQRRFVLRRLVLVVELGFFLLQVAGIRQQDGA